MEYGQQLQIRVEAVLDELAAVPTREDNPSWMLRYQETKNRLNALRNSIYKQGMIDGAFVAELDRVVAAARATIKTLV